MSNLTHLRSRSRSVAVGAVAVGCLGLVAGCGSSRKSANPTTPTSAGAAAASISASGGSPVTGAPSTTAAPTSGKSINATCPSAAAVSAASGKSFPNPVQSGQGSQYLSCNYSDPAAGSNLVIVFAPSGGASAAAYKSVADRQAQAQHVTVTAVSGIGDAAYEFTDPGSPISVASGIGNPTVHLSILVGSKTVNIGALLTPPAVLAVAHVALGS